MHEYLRDKYRSGFKNSVYIFSVMILNPEILILDLFSLNLLIIVYAYIYVCNFSSKKECI